jgi:O-antigen ligase
MRQYVLAKYSQTAIVPGGANSHKMKALINPALLMLIVTVCLFEFILHRQGSYFRQLEAGLLSSQWMTLLCLAVWCGTFIFLTFSLSDLLLVSLLLIATVLYFKGYIASGPKQVAVTLIGGVMLGKGARGLLNGESKMKNEENNPEVRIFLMGLVGLLAFSSWWHLDMSDNFYHGPRWMGLWSDPNIYGMLMSAGALLSTGMLAEMNNEAYRMKHWGWRPLAILFSIAAGMMAVGLLASYSRGAWVGTIIGLLYLTKAHDKFKWRVLLPGILIITVIAWYFWNGTTDTAPWYSKRLDLGRPSAQHRVVAWKAGFKMMRDHPLGVGWNQAVKTYEEHYSPPEDGAAAITTNDYLMLGTQLGCPGLICFVAYLGLCFRGKNIECRMKNTEGQVAMTQFRVRDSGFEIKTACRAGVLAMLVAFWFDGGLFKLPTATIFWILLELGCADSIQQKATEGTKTHPVVA